MTRQTSIDAFRQIQESGVLGKYQFMIYNALFEAGPLTSMEVTVQCGRSGNDVRSISPRMAELRDMGLIIEVGKKQCSITGRTVLAWDVTSKIPNGERIKKKTSKQIIEELRTENDELKTKLNEALSHLSARREQSKPVDLPRRNV